MLNHISGHMELSRCAPDYTVTSAEGLMSQRMEAAATEGGFKHSSSGRSCLIPSQAGLTMIELLCFFVCLFSRFQHLSVFFTDPL